jgi:hypothetical protein
MTCAIGRHRVPVSRSLFLDSSNDDVRFYDPGDTWEDGYSDYTDGDDEEEYVEASVRVRLSCFKRWHRACERWPPFQFPELASGRCCDRRRLRQTMEN